jgi:hypothetical protein
LRRAERWNRIGAMAVINDSSFVIHCGEILTAEGEKLLTVAKGTFVLRRGAAELAPVPEPEARPVRAANVTWGDPVTTPPKYPCDIAPLKAASDVVVVAKAHAPNARAVPAFDAGVVVGPLSKRLRVHGLRVWQANGSGLSAPRPFVEQEIRYDAAWGGLDLSDPMRPVGDMRNPVGNGWVRDVAALTHQMAPSIEDPAEPIRSVATRPAPAGLGPIGPHWSPRREHAGTYDEAWQRDQAPLPPSDLDPRHHQCASPGLVADPPLQGGEPVQLENLTPAGGLVRFSLPRVRAVFDHAVKNQPAGHFEPHIDTVVIDTLHVPAGSTVVVEIVWRSLVSMPRRIDDHEVLVRARG